MFHTNAYLINIEQKKGVLRCDLIQARILLEKSNNWLGFGGGGGGGEHESLRMSARKTLLFHV